MIADTRTNAGLDNIATFKKLHVFEERGDRVVALATAGNLSISQSVLTLISEGFDANGDGTIQTINTVPSMFRAAQLVGQAIREVRRVDGESLEQSGGFEVQMLLGGQVRDGRLRLFQIYNAGNFIEATIDTPYLQIGEHKYGKPILDRVVTPETSLEDAQKAALLSMDSTMKSNLSVGMPLDLAVIETDACRVSTKRRIMKDDPQFSEMSHAWSEALRDAFVKMPI